MSRFSKIHMAAAIGATGHDEWERMMLNFRKVPIRRPVAFGHHWRRIMSLALLMGSGLVQAGETGAVDFNQDIRPILRQHCTACHGGVKAAGGISFVYRDRVFQAGESGEHPVIAGKPDESELIRRIESKDEDEQMPPSDSGHVLNEKEKGTLRRWIEQGAIWNELWSLQPITNPPPPKVDEESWIASPLDRFVLHQLQRRGLRHQETAPPAAWLRRVTLDLTGLPPQAEDYASFAEEHASSPREAKEHVVSQLLASDAFGERWATVWLDLARYSDTFGMEKDPHRTIWPWRDWVIRAFNSDMPFDEFTLKQLAGDQLVHATSDDVLATAFHRNTQNNTEGGTDDEEFRMAAVVDRVNTIWTTWNATTFGCVRCHAHPYDPYPQTDYYRFSALWNNTEDCDQNDDFPWLKWSPAAEHRATLWTLQKSLVEMKHDLNRTGQEVAGKARWSPIKIVKAATSAGDIAVRDTYVVAGGTLPVVIEYRLTLADVAGIRAIRFQLHPDSDDPHRWPERGQVLSKIEAFTNNEGVREEIKLRYVVADQLSGPFDANESLASGAGGFGSYPVMAGPRWCVVVLDQALPDHYSSVDLVLKMSAASNSGTQSCALRKFSLQGSMDRAWNDWSGSEGFLATTEKIRQLNAQLKTIPAIEVPVMFERLGTTRRETRVFHRGNRLSPGDPAEPGLPELLAKDRSITTRQAFAQWLCSDEHPLTSRTLANRLWAEMFGAGIVETLEDFGTSGAEPTHPELLDHLAWRLAHDHHWSIKSFLREIALSATYGQSSVTSDASFEADPTNRWLARGPRRRLSAEMIRDQALAISGLLSRKAFGPPVFPPQPEGVWNTVYSGQTWVTSVGEDRYRRSIYTFQKRTSGYPSFLTFDAPTRELCSARRVPTNTPLQALVTLNDPAFFELAQGLAKRMANAGKAPLEQIAFGCRLFTLAEPPPTMIDRLLTLHHDAKMELEQDPEAIGKLGANPNEAALTLVANTLFNLDAFLVR